MTNESSTRICPSCGDPISDSSFCPNCGHKFEKGPISPTIIDQGASNFKEPNQQIPQEPNSYKKKFYEKNWFIIIMLILFFPVGLFLMWKYSKWHKAVRTIVTVLIALCFIGSLVNNYSVPVEKDTKMATSNDSSTLPSDDQVTSDTNEQVDESNEAAPKNKKIPQPDNSLTLGQKNALKSAQDYLDYTAFSYSGLIEQLEFEGFSTEDSTYAVNNCGADWNEQAALTAQSYLDYTSFSRSGLIEQLEFEGFTSEQAEYGATSVGY